jgi:cobalt-precorrin-5B (C1)-methyltransferase
MQITEIRIDFCIKASVFEGHEMEQYVTVGGRRLRKGYTTGTCAAAAAKAAVYMLASGNKLEKVKVHTPAGIALELPVNDVIVSNNFAECSVIKDGGDDPDATTGLKIFARAEFTSDGRIELKAGEGIGTVTLPGLKVEPGKPAINPVPLKMIHEAVAQVLPAGKGAILTLRVPGGDEAAKRTYNPKLGIVGGISIIGTTGIVEPMSEDAWKETLALELSILRSKGHKSCAFVFGNYGEDSVAGVFGIQRDRIVKVSNFIGFMLDKAATLGIKTVLVAGHLGKLVKVAGGIFHTHSRTADARMEILAAYSGLEGASTDVMRRIYSCRTTAEAAAVIESEGLERVYKRIVANASEKCAGYTYGKVFIGTALFSEDKKLLHADENAYMAIKELKG